MHIKPPHIFWWVPAMLILGALAVVSGCGIAPAHPVPGAGPALSLPFNGVYDATFHTPWVGPVSTTLIAAPTKDGFKANTRPGVAWGMIGGVEGFLGPALAPFVFPSGMILTWTSTLPTTDKPGEGTIGIGRLSILRVRTRMTGPNRPVEIVLKDGRVVALLTLVPAHSKHGPKTNYTELASHVSSGIAANLYDPDLASSSQVRGYAEDLALGAAKATDDIEFLFAAALSGRTNIKFTQPLIYRRQDARAESTLYSAYPSIANPQQVSFDESTRIATLHVDAFMQADAVDHAFEEVLSKHPCGIILDLHNCVGVEIASLRAAAWVIDKPADAGIFFGRDQRSAVLHGHVAQVPAVTVCGPASFAALQKTLDTRGAARVTITPDPRRFSGPVAVLTSSRTSSSAEPLVWLLKETGRAKVYGEATAGRPLLSREVDAGQGWVLRVASQDYTPATGARISGRGVRPDFTLDKRAAAARAAADLLRAAGEAPQTPTE